MIFLDTSAICALASRWDEQHREAKRIMAKALDKGEEFLTHDYVIVESAALIQNRLGFDAAERFLREITRLHIVWIDATLHSEAYGYFLQHGRRNLSFVDCASFTVMERENVSYAFAFDPDFIEAGFKLYTL